MIAYQQRGGLEGGRCTLLRCVRALRRWAEARSPVAEAEEAPHPGARDGGRASMSPRLPPPGGRVGMAGAHAARGRIPAAPATTAAAADRWHNHASHPFGRTCGPAQATRGQRDRPAASDVSRGCLRLRACLKRGRRGGRSPSHPPSKFHTPHPLRLPAHREGDSVDGVGRRRSRRAQRPSHTASPACERGAGGKGHHRGTPVSKTQIGSARTNLVERGSR